MNKPIQLLSDKLWWLFFGTFILLALLLVLTLVRPTPTTTACIAAHRPSGSSIYQQSGMNAVADTATWLVEEASDTLSSSVEVTTCGTGAMANTVSRGATTVAHAAAFSASAVARGIGNTIIFMARTLGVMLAFVFYIPSSVLGLVADTPVVSAVIKPATLTPSPVISPFQSPATALVSLAGAQPAAATKPSDVVPQWPIHGIITTQFGVAHWPYQPTHTGLDISDGKPSGITPIKPFKPGRVIEVVHSHVSLGNHVVVDHGNGITSVYGHMYATSVQVGQMVDQNTTLGLEGSTGVSTGTHLHFEIRVNGQVVDPRKFISSPL